MDSNRHFARVKWVDFEGDIYFSNRIRPIPMIVELFWMVELRVIARIMRSTLNSRRLSICPHD